MGAADFVRRHRALRHLLAPARRLRAYEQRLTAPNSRMQRTAGRIALGVRALPSRAALPRRRADLHGLLATQPAPPRERRLVSVVVAPGSSIASARNVDTELITTPEDGSGPLVCFLGPTAQPLDDGWLGQLSAVICDDVVAATPVLVWPEHRFAHATEQDLLVAACGYDIALTGEGAPMLRARNAGAHPDAQFAVAKTEDIDAASSTCFVVARAALVAAGGIDPELPPDAAIVDLCVRLRAAGGRIVVAPMAVVADHRPVRARAELAGPFAMRPRDWDAVVARRGPLLVRRVHDPERPRIAITTSAPSAKMAARWGDWHFGGDLMRALQRAGYEVRLQTADQADSIASRSCDLQLVLHGRTPIERTSGQRHVVWVISHPETMTTEAADAADLVLVASERFAAELRTRTSTPVETLLQATDQHRFRSLPSDPRHAHPVVVVAKTRTIMRPIVADALAVGIRPAIFGSGWEAYVDPDLVVADYVANDELPLVYASAGVVLNDHWDTMREHGFVSNRIFDVLACGTPVISDHLPEIPALFGDAVATYREREELRQLVELTLGQPEAARARARRGQQTVLTGHTFDARVNTLSELLARHGLFTPFSDPGRKVQD
jgi:hypothetical protein